MSLADYHAAAAHLKEGLQALDTLISTDSDAGIAEAWSVIADIARHLEMRAGTNVVLAHRLHGDLGRIIAGTTKPVRILEEQLGMTRPEATTVSTQAHRLFGPLLDQAPEGEDAVVTTRRRKEAEGRRREAERLMRAEMLSAAKRTLIETKLQRLATKDALVRETLRKDIVEYAVEHSHADTKRKLAATVASINAGLENTEQRSRDRRRASISDADEYGNVTIRATVSAEIGAAFKARVDQQLRAPRPSGDARSFSQRYVDAVSAVLCGETREATLVVSISGKDFDARDRALLPTNTGISLTPQQVLRLGIAKYGFAAVHDPATGEVLELYRTARTATVEQRIALMASELVCTYPGCSVPLSRSEIHHLVPWDAGGNTNLDNLTIHCRTHHSDNDDTWKHPLKHHAERDPDTRQVGVVQYGTMRFNNTWAAGQAAGARIREQAWPEGYAEDHGST